VAASELTIDTGTKVAAVPLARSLSGGGDPDGLKLVYMAIQKASKPWMLPVPK
jgi:hypothetical protein